MATPKYFVVTKSETESLVKTTTAALATAAVLASSGTPILADHDAIRAHFAVGGELHPASIEEGKGKIWLVPTEAGNALVRAKNAADATTLVHGRDVTVRVASQDDLVRLLTARVVPIELLPSPKASATAAPEHSTAPAEPALA